MSRSSSARRTALKIVPAAAPDADPAPTPFQITAARIRRLVPLRDLDIAPENLRAGDAPDDEIPLLADTLFAAGQLQPLTVRPGHKGERDHMALDGRRRLLALRLLADQGRIDDGFLVDVFIETDPERQAAAVVLTNTAAPVHIADVVSAIGRMIASGLCISAIARALGYAEIEIKRLAALSALPEVALEALKAGRLNLKQARLVARLPDRDEQIELARAALDGQGFQDWRVSQWLDAAYLTANDARYSLVGPDRYAARGGRTEIDLFGERPPVLLDPVALTDAWTLRAKEIAAPFEAEGLTVHVTAGPDLEPPEDFEIAGYVYSGMLAAAEMAAYRDARTRHEEACEAAARVLAETTEPGPVDEAVGRVVRERLVMDQIALNGRVATTLVFRPSARTGVEVRTWTPIEARKAEDPATAAEIELPEVAPDRPAPFLPPRASAPEPDVEGLNNGLHALRTEVATRGLIRALSDHPRTAMTALIARLFGQVSSRAHRSRSEFALGVTAQRFEPAGGRVIESLDGTVWVRLDARRAAWEASGLTLLGWIHGLEDEERSAFLAELAALTLDLREERTSMIRRLARAEAAELAALSGADLTRDWTPDVEFLTAHSKPHLLSMLEEMGQSDVRAAALKKPELVALVAERAAALRWAPAALSWTLPSQTEAAEGDVAADPANDRIDDASASEAEDGTGAFEVTAAGEEALERVVTD